ncbi:vWA domain-containing protein [Rufibacter aurantiacus]|uniref:vWA domain-containing protein n=1 Tax=Rufibacter aurantiacus TaxID=2817374 RepID=UPI001B314218|nr:vWA domain-containing protein [Rufibacter aurantiacus]
MQIHNLIILDESGSMNSIKKETMSGFNELVQTLKGMKGRFPEQEHFISLFTFNGEGIKPRLYKLPVKGLKEIDEKIYRPYSQTPLFDAIGTSVSKLRDDLGDLANTNVLVTILTDGRENASREYTGAQVKRLIEEQKQKGWTFTYIGANHDVEHVATSISIPNSIAFKSTPKGTTGVFSRERTSRMEYLRKLNNNEDISSGYYDESE